MFVKLFQKMLDSSIWLESDSTVRVWVTLLLSMDSDGFAQFASVENLARRARVKPSLTARAIAILEAPDPESSTPDDDGRRIKRVHGGWQIVNCRKYRDIASHGDLRASRCKSEQPGTTRRNSEQCGLPTGLSGNEISKSVPEKETETETKTEKEEIPADSDLIVFRIATTHPKAKQYRSDVELPQALQTAVIRAIEHEGGNHQQVLEWEQGYAASDSAKYAGDPIKHFQQFQYRPEFWRNSNGNGNKGSKFAELGALLAADAEASGKLAHE